MIKRHVHGLCRPCHPDKEGVNLCITQFDTATNTPLSINGTGRARERLPAIGNGQRLAAGFGDRRARSREQPGAAIRGRRIMRSPYL